MIEDKTGCGSSCNRKPRGFKGADFLLPGYMNVSAHACLCNSFKFRNIDSTFSGKENRHME